MLVSVAYLISRQKVNDADEKHLGAVVVEHGRGQARVSHGQLLLLFVAALVPVLYVSHADQKAVVDAVVGHQEVHIARQGGQHLAIVASPGAELALKLVVLPDASLCVCAV